MIAKFIIIFRNITYFYMHRIINIIIINNIIDIITAKMELLP